MALSALNRGDAILEKMSGAYETLNVGTRRHGPTKASWADRARRVRPKLADESGPGR